MDSWKATQRIDFQSRIICDRRYSGCSRGGPALQAIGGIHGHRAYPVVAEVLLHFEDQRRRGDQGTIVTLFERVERDVRNALEMQIEQAELGSARELPYSSKLGTLPGVGRILGMTITMEVGDIKRFAESGNFASYCRTVEAQRTSNNKKKGENNSKCGNKYLAWAFVEAANFAKRYDAQSRRWYDRKQARTCTVIATKALAEFLKHVMQRPLYAHVVKHNIGSIRVLEKCGFTRQGENDEEIVLKL